MKETHNPDEEAIFDAPPTTEAKVTCGDRLLATGQAYISRDRTAGTFLPTDGKGPEIPRDGASLTLWGNDDAIPMVNVRQSAKGGMMFRFTLPQDQMALRAK
jgi:hypothetical protein